MIFSILLRIFFHILIVCSLQKEFDLDIGEQIKEITEVMIMWKLKNAYAAEYAQNLNFPLLGRNG